MNQTTTAGIDLDSLTRYDAFETDEGDELRVDPNGRWVRFDDVRELLARRAESSVTVSTGERERVLAYTPLESAAWRAAGLMSSALFKLDATEDIARRLAAEIQGMLPVLSSGADDARAALASPAVPEGYKLVPIEPTPEMIQAACRDHGYPGGSRRIYRDGYRSMVAAAPAVSQKDGAAVEGRDWIEDAAHENGNYQCRCATCGNTFIGHKRRVTCKVCAATTVSASPTTSQSEQASERDFRLSLDSTTASASECKTCCGTESISNPLGWQLERIPCPDCAPSRDAALLAPKAIEDIADELEAEAMNYEGDFADTVNGCVEALRELVSPAATTASASPPVVPDDLVAAIRIYGDYRADSHPAASAQFGEIIKAIRVWAAALARAPLPAQIIVPEWVYRSARDLAVSIWRDNYKNTAPNWEPLEDLAGVISQIDNMVAGLRRSANTGAVRRLAERLKWMLDADQFRNVEAMLSAIAAPDAIPDAEAAVNPDDAAVDRFAAAMKTKMAASRAKGRSGWDNEALCPASRLQDMLIEHLAKGDPVDVGNFAMMLWNRGERVAAPAQAGELADVLRDMLAIQEACGLHTDEYAPGSVIEYIKELEGESVAAPAQAGDARIEAWEDRLRREVTPAVFDVMSDGYRVSQGAEHILAELQERRAAMSASQCKKGGAQ
jgi:hypothetical protein